MGRTIHPRNLAGSNINTIREARREPPLGMNSKPGGHLCRKGPLRDCIRPLAAVHIGGSNYERHSYQ